MTDVTVMLGSTRYRLHYTGKYISGMGWGFRLLDLSGTATRQLAYIWRWVDGAGVWHWQINHDAQLYADAGALVASVVARQGVAV